jgi:hypothetical protein
MFHKENKSVPIEDLLKDIDGFNGNPDVKTVIMRFIKNELMSASGVIIISTQGKHVNIDGTKFSDPEAVWALEKAKHQILSKGLSFND